MMWRRAVCGLLLAAITLSVQASEDPTESLAGVHDLSKQHSIVLYVLEYINQITMSESTCSSGY